jgi:hypothetical protein
MESAVNGKAYKTFITKSRAGHYAVTIYQMYGTRKQVVFSQKLISTIFLAREVANEFLASN